MTDSLRLDAASILRRYGLRPRRSLGQNFLEDPVALEQVVHAADVSPEDVVLEIGPGIGGLTRCLAPHAQRVIGIEVDAYLAAICRTELQDISNVEIVHGDVLSSSPKALGLPPDYLVAANIPYYITSSILKHLLESEPRPRRIVLTVQKEVAARICARPPAMSLLAVSVQIHGDVQIVGGIPASAFHPKPKVDSAIIRIDCFGQPRLNRSRLDVFFRLAKAGFWQPRKMLRNSMASGLQAPTAEIEELLHQAGVDPRRRAETVSMDEWIHLTEILPVTGG